MAQDPRVPHYVKPNEVSRVPRRHVTLYSLPTRRTVKGGQVNTWSCAVATFRHGEKGRKTHETTHQFTATADLWQAVSGHTVKGSRTVLWAHNLGNEVRLTRALYELPKLGWELVAHNLAPRGTWMIWGQDDRRLTMVDIASVFPKLLPELGKLFGIGLPPKPQANEGVGGQLHRAGAYERIIRAAVTAYLGWMDGADLGNWQLTGAGQAFAVFRHKHLTHKLLVHDDARALDMERRAMWTGRCEAYWHGSFRREVIHEWDFTSAYPTICRDHPLPTKLVGPMPTHYPWRRIMTDPKVAILMHAEVTTSQPVVPALHDGRILWPVGKFETVLWSPELVELANAGATIRPITGYLYRTSPALREWAAWVLDQLGQPDDIVPAWQKVILKHWSTALIGRFAMAYPEWEQVATSRQLGVERRTCIDIDEDRTYEIMQVGHTLFQQGGLVEWQHSQPAITGYVMSIMRCKLWRLMQALPPRTVLYADTDSVLTTDQEHARMAAVAETDLGRGLRLKRSWDGFSIYGPRQIVTGNRVRVSGVPVAAQRESELTFSGQVWENLAASMNRKRADRIVISDRQWTAHKVDRRRNGPEMGWTEPIEIGVR